MERLNEDGQWIILMGFIVSITIFLLAILVAQSALVGKTTADSVLEFPKKDIQDLRSELMSLDWNVREGQKQNITILTLSKKSAVVNYTVIQESDFWTLGIHYNNGQTSYNETYLEYFK
jgi:hypothetical protein